MSSKRKIVVDGSEYLWVYGGPGIVVWDAANKRHQGAIRDVTGLDWCAVERGQWKKTCDGMVRPHQVANWIRIHLQGKPRVQREARLATSPEATPPVAALPGAGHPVLVRPAQGELYLVVAESGEYEEYDFRVVEAHLDPQTALDRVDALNTRQRIRRAMCKALYAPIFEGYDTHLKAATDAERQAWSEACRERFFREHGVTDPGEQAFIEKCPSSVNQPRYRVQRTKLYDAATATALPPTLVA